MELIVVAAFRDYAVGDRVVGADALDLQHSPFVVRVAEVAAPDAPAPTSTQGV